MKKGFIVAKLKFKNNVVFHCMDGLGRHRFFEKHVMICGLNNGEYVNGFVCCGRNAESYIRLAEGVPTIKFGRRFSKQTFGEFTTKYLNSNVALNSVKRSRKIAEKYLGDVSKIKCDAQVRNGAGSEMMEYSSGAAGGSPARWDVNTGKMNNARVFVNGVDKGVVDIRKKPMTSEGYFFKDGPHTEVSGGQEKSVQKRDGGEMVSKIWPAVEKFMHDRDRSGCLHFKMESSDTKNTWAVCFGWMDGFDVDENGDTERLCGKVAYLPNNSLTRCDYDGDWLMPVSADGEVDDTEISTMSRENIAYLLNEWRRIKRERGI